MSAAVNDIKEVKAQIVGGKLVNELELLSNEGNESDVFHHGAAVIRVPKYKDEYYMETDGTLWSIFDDYNKIVKKDAELVADGVNIAPYLDKCYSHKHEKRTAAECQFFPKIDGSGLQNFHWDAQPQDWLGFGEDGFAKFFEDWHKIQSKGFGIDTYGNNFIVSNKDGKREINFIDRTLGIDNPDRENETRRALLQIYPTRVGDPEIRPLLHTQILHALRGLNLGTRGVLKILESVAK